MSLMIILIQMILTSFEVAIIDENLDDEFQEWQVKGWQTREDINKLIIDNSGDEVCSV